MNPIVSKCDTQMAFLNFTISQAFLMVPPTNKNNYICLNGDTNLKVGGGVGGVKYCKYCKTKE